MDDLKKAEEYLKKRKYKVALKLFANVANQNPNDPLAFYGIARCQQILGQYTESIAAANKAIELNPGWANPYTTLALALYFGMHDSAAGLKEAVRAYEIDPNLFETTFCYGSILLREGKPEEGISLLKQAAKINPRSPNPHINLSIVYIEQNKIKDYFEERLTIFKIRPSFRNGFFLLHAFEIRYKAPNFILTLISLLIPGWEYGKKDFLIFLIIPIPFLVWVFWRCFRAVEQRNWKDFRALLLSLMLLGGLIYLDLRPFIP